MLGADRFLILKLKMIKPNELRLENFILNRHNEIDIVTDRIFQDFRFPKMDGNFGYKGVKTTEEWLLNAGFEKTDKYWLFTNDLKFLIELDIEDNYCLRVKLSKYLSAFICQVNFIHQLQNAMFVLRGEELVFSSVCP